MGSTLLALLTMAKGISVAGFLLLYFSAIIISSVQGRSGAEKNLTLSIIHMNDVHAHFDEVNVNTGRCHKEQANNKECFGGMARMYTAIKNLTEQENSLLLNAGDYFQGTMWFSKLKYDPVVKFGNQLNWTAMGLGNHDFDLGATDLAGFSKEVNYPLLACNLVEENGKTIKYNSSLTMDINGKKVGIIGYVTTDTPNITAGSIPQLSFLDEIVSIRAEAKKLKAETPPVDILIALGHSGYEKDLDIVVGGHSHSFLYTGTPSKYMIENVEGEFPTYIKQASGRVVPVVQVYKYSKYLGNLKLNFDANGELMTPVESVGVEKAEVILLDTTYEMDPYIEGQLKEYRDKNLTEFYEEVGNSTVLLAKVENEESNIGNIITDSMLQYSKWTDTTIAFINNGGIRGTIDPGVITGEDIIQVLPFGNTIDRVTMTGKNIKGLFEEYAKGLCPNETCHPPTFLQMSGLKVVYDIYEDTAKDRVTSIKEKCKDEWCDLSMDKKYNVSLVSFLAGGGSYLYSFPDWFEDHQVGDVDYPAFKQYIKENSPIQMTTEGRITINYHSESGSISMRATPLIFVVFVLINFLTVRV